MPKVQLAKGPKDQNNSKIVALKDGLEKAKSQYAVSKMQQCAALQSHIDRAMSSQTKGIKVEGRDDMLSTATTGRSIVAAEAITVPIPVTPVKPVRATNALSSETTKTSHMQSERFLTESEGNPNNTTITEKSLIRRPERPQSWNDISKIYGQAVVQIHGMENGPVHIPEVLFSSGSLRWLENLSADSTLQILDHSKTSKGSGRSASIFIQKDWIDPFKQYIMFSFNGGLQSSASQDPSDIRNHVALWKLGAVIKLPKFQDKAMEIMCSMFQATDPVKLDLFIAALGPLPKKPGKFNAIHALRIELMAWIFWQGLTDAVGSDTIQKNVQGFIEHFATAIRGFGQDEQLDSYSKILAPKRFFVAN